MLLELEEYTKIAKDIARNYLSRNRLWFETKYKTGNDVQYKTLISDELIGECVRRLVRADMDWYKFESLPLKNNKKKLSLHKYRRMNAIYAIRTYFQDQRKLIDKRKNLPKIENFMAEPSDTLSREEERLKALVRVEKSSLQDKHRVYMLELLNGKMVSDIAKENHTKSHIVERIIREAIKEI